MPKRSRPPVQDLAPSMLTAAERAAYDVLVADPTMAPLVAVPGRVARDLVAIAVGVDVAREIVAAGVWCRSEPTKAPRKSGFSFLRKWVARAAADARGRAAPRSNFHGGLTDAETAEARDLARTIGTGCNIATDVLAGMPVNARMLMVLRNWRKAPMRPSEIRQSGPLPPGCDIDF